jgi:hypothetical protein
VMTAGTRRGAHAFDLVGAGGTAGAGVGPPPGQGLGWGGWSGRRWHGGVRACRSRWRSWGGDEGGSSSWSRSWAGSGERETVDRWRHET